MSEGEKGADFAPMGIGRGLSEGNMLPAAAGFALWVALLLVVFGLAALRALG